MPTNRVFVVNEPLRRDPDTGEWEPALNLDPAREFGELTRLLPAGRVPDDLQVTVDALDRALVDYTAADYLLPVGHPLAIGCAIALAAQRTGGPVRFLVWHAGRRAYTPREATLPGFARALIGDEA